MIHEKDKKLFWVIFIIVTLDILSTLCALSVGSAHESNELIADLMDGGEYLIVLWLPLVMLIAFWFYDSCVYMEVLPAFRVTGLLYFMIATFAVANNFTIYFCEFI